jgi:hypothetical protein
MTIEVKTCAAQGDILFRRVKKIPDGYAKVERKGDIVVSHSETGHHHVVRDACIERWEGPANPLVCYLQMGDVCSFDVEHLRSYDTHETLRIVGKPGDTWEARRQREHTPEGWRRVQD